MKKLFSLREGGRKQTRLLGLDIGDKRIGVAVAEGNVIALRGVVDNTDFSQAMRVLNQICREENIFKIIIGIPKSSDNIQADKIHAFALQLVQNLKTQVDFVDETLTSREAERELQSQKIDPKSQRYKEEVDKLAAKYILEQYLNKKIS